jgi:nucleoside-diphosphate-sugar epimerase
MLTTILGAGGPIGDELAKILVTKNASIRLVGRTPKPFAGAEIVAADISDREQTLRAVDGSDVVYLLVGLPYELTVWQEMWPRIMANAIEACKRARAKLIFFDNVYMYGEVHVPMTEQTPYAPCSKKGAVRAEIAITLMDEVKAGNLTAMIARSADFYGPNTKNGIPNVLVFEPLAKGATASWLVNAMVPHSLTFIPDAAHGLAMLAERESAWNQVWHLPTALSPPTGKEFIDMVAEAFGVPPKYRVLSKPMLRVAGWFDRRVRESHEMLYQNAAPYIFDSTKFATEFEVTGTDYSEGIRIAAESYRAFLAR